MVHLGQDREQWRELWPDNDLSGKKKERRDILTSWATIIFSRRILLRIFDLVTTKIFSGQIIKVRCLYQAVKLAVTMDRCPSCPVSAIDLPNTNTASFHCCIHNDDCVNVSDSFNCYWHCCQFAAGQRMLIVAPWRLFEQRAPPYSYLMKWTKSFVHCHSGVKYASDDAPPPGLCSYSLQKSNTS
jgi:hypothetical protein